MPSKKHSVRKDRPADYVIALFGGVRATAKALRMAPSSVSVWKHRDGKVPASRFAQIITVAAQQHQTVTLDQLVNGVEWVLR